MPVQYEIVNKITGQWTTATAGGSVSGRGSNELRAICKHSSPPQPNNRETYKNNPHYVVTVPGTAGETVPMLIKLEAPRKYSVGLMVTVQNVSGVPPM